MFTTIPDETVIYGNLHTLSPNVYSKTGVSFAGWVAKRSSDNKWIYCDREGKNRG